MRKYQLTLLSSFAQDSGPERRLCWASGMTPHFPAALILAALVLVPVTASAGQTAEELRTRGLELGFNLDHAEAVDTFRKSIAADPENLAGYRFLTGALWSNALFEQGAITTDDFTGQGGSPFRARRANAELQLAASDLLRRTAAAAAAIGRDGSASSVEAMYQVGAAYRLLSTLRGTIDGSQWSSFSAARRAYQEHERVLKFDPLRTDAGLTLGLLKFWIATKPMLSRVVARVAGLDSDRNNGIRLVEAAAAAATSAQASALFALVVIYQQQGRDDDALRVIADLQRRFPRNRLLWLEAANTQLRIGRAGDARASIEHGLRILDGDARPRAYGELARWHYSYGLALARLNQNGAAIQQLRAALENESLEWARDRTRVELDRLTSLRRQ